MVQGLKEDFRLQETHFTNPEFQKEARVIVVGSVIFAQF
jgi:hypothetical protein